MTTDRDTDGDRASTPDMSPEAIAARLREVGALYELCMSLGRARRVGPVSAAGRAPDGDGEPDQRGA